jgi:hypothetical protein
MQNMGVPYLVLIVWLKLLLTHGCSGVCLGLLESKSSLPISLFWDWDNFKGG